MLFFRGLLFLTWMMVTSALIMPSGANAQENMGQSWKNLSPEVREQKRRQFFMSLPDSKIQSLREKQLKFQSLSKDQQRAICRKFYAQNGYYPPTCQSLLSP